jgi:hypothetical protein
MMKKFVIKKDQSSFVASSLKLASLNKGDLDIYFKFKLEIR